LISTYITLNFCYTNVCCVCCVCCVCVVFVVCFLCVVIECVVCFVFVFCVCCVFCVCVCVCVCIVPRSTAGSLSGLFGRFGSVSVWQTWSRVLGKRMIHFFNSAVYNSEHNWSTLNIHLGTQMICFFDHGIFLPRPLPGVNTRGTCNSDGVPSFR
jgi:hypothetical protein